MTPLNGSAGTKLFFQVSSLFLALYGVRGILGLGFIAEGSVRSRNGIAAPFVGVIGRF